MAILFLQGKLSNSNRKTYSVSYIDGVLRRHLLIPILYMSETQISPTWQLKPNTKTPSNRFMSIKHSLSTTKSNLWLTSNKNSVLITLLSLRSRCTSLDSLRTCNSNQSFWELRPFYNFNFFWDNSKAKVRNWGKVGTCLRRKSFCTRLLGSSGQHRSTHLSAVMVVASDFVWARPR